MRLSQLFFLIPGVVAVGCGDNIEPATDEAAPIESDPGPLPEPHPLPDPEPEVEARPVAVGFRTTTLSCDSPTGELEAFGFYTDTQEPLTNIACQFIVDNPGQLATYLEGCLVQHEFPSGGTYTVAVNVYDADTGHNHVKTDVVFIEPAFTADLEVTAPECGLELSYNAIASAGGEFSINISPAENVLTDYALQKQATVQVSQPGTYTVKFDAEDERATGAICTREVVREVTVVDCHDHTPTCGH